MNTIPLEYQPFVPGIGFFILLGIAAVTLILVVITIMDILFAKFRNKEDRILWFLLIVVTAGIASYIYIFKRKELVLSKAESRGEEVKR